MKNNPNALAVKDLVTIGVFDVIYFVCVFAIGMMGVIPILYLVYPAVVDGQSSEALGTFYFRNDHSPDYARLRTQLYCTAPISPYHFTCRRNQEAWKIPLYAPNHALLCHFLHLDM